MLFYPGSRPFDVNLRFWKLDSSLFFVKNGYSGIRRGPGFEEGFLMDNTDSAETLD